MIKVYRRGPAPSEQWMAVPQKVWRGWPPALVAGRTCCHCGTVYTSASPAWRCEHYHEREPMSKPKPALRKKIANLSQLRAMSRSELRANTCSACEATYTSADAAQECRDWHRSQR